MNRLWIIPAVLTGCTAVVLTGLLVTNSNLQAITFIEQPSQLDQKGVSDPYSNSKTVTSTNTDDYHDKSGDCSIPASYPKNIQNWCHLIELAAHETALPASLIAAVILQESSGDPLAYSSSGAVGLMQVMPRDGKASSFVCINGPCFSSRPTIQELQDPAFNVAYGSKMLADLFNRYGSYREALLRYGPKDVGYVYADIVLNHWEKHQ